jgi:hypothetical protein
MERLNLFENNEKDKPGDRPQPFPGTKPDPYFPNTKMERIPEPRHISEPEQQEQEFTKPEQAAA